jgi:hypothetical protein
MTRQVHDQFAKEYLEELLSPLGKVKKSQKLKSEVLEVDVWFEPFPSPPSPDIPLGILGRMVSHIALFEPYRNPPSDHEICSCLSKLLAARQEAVREAQRTGQALSERELPVLWILAPTLSPRMREMMWAKEAEGEGWARGIYFLAPILRAGLVVIHQLPVREETLWLRVLGKGSVQRQAVEELVGLPADNPYRENLLAILADWRQNLELRDNRTREEQEDIMNLSPAYLKQREEWKLEGRQEGRAEGRQEGRAEGRQEGRAEGRQEEGANLVRQLLQHRFGEVPQNLTERIRGLSLEQLESLAKALLDFESLSELVSWLER